MSKFSKVLNLDEATRVDVASSTVTYVGKAIPNTTPATAKWKISRLTSDVSGGLTIEFAGNGDYLYIWNDRASLSYS